MSAPSPELQVEYADLPPAYHRWKRRVLIAFCLFYIVNYLGRFNFSLIQSAIIEDLGIDRATAGWINSWMFWGFALGGLVHGRLAERLGYRRVVLMGAVGTALFNFLASFGATANEILVPWALAGFMNAATWAPAIGLISQWWPRRERGRAIGAASAAAGVSMLTVWMVAPWVAAAYGWRAAFRYPPLLIALLGIAYFLAVRDRPARAGLPEYVESEEVSCRAERAARKKELGLAAFLHLMRNWRFFVACQVRGLDHAARYGIVTWAPLYYAQAGGFELKKMALVTFAYPVGIILGPIVGGMISDRVFRSNRSVVIGMSGLLSGAAVAGIALSPADNIPLAVLFLTLGGFAINMAPLPALAADLAGRSLAGTAVGILSFHGYAYGALQAVFFGWLSLAVPNGWFWVFATIAATRLVSVGAIWQVKA